MITVAFLGDTLGVLAGLLAGFWIRFKSGWITFGVESSHPHVLGDYQNLFLVGIIFFHATFFYLGFYRAENLYRFRSVASIILRGITFWALAYLCISLVMKFDPPISRIYAFCSFLCTVGILLAWRRGLNLLLRAEFVARHLRQRVLFVGWTPEAERLERALDRDSGQLYRLLGVVTTHPAPAGAPSLAAPALGSLEELHQILPEHQPDVLVVADPNLDQRQTLQVANLCEKHFVQFKRIPNYFQIMISGLRLEILNGVPVMGVADLPLDKILNRVLKRMVDMVGAVVGLVLSAPIIAVCGAVIYWESPGAIFYRQTRCGYRGKLFRIVKLRSMRLDAEAKGGAQWASRDDPRRLKFGAFLRKWNLDELPQFWNVLVGEMTLVGPRPERPELIQRFLEEIPHYNARHFSKPGMTGWAQVNGYRGDTSLVERVKYDLFYLENWTLWLDFQIMVQTFFRYQNAG